MYYCCVKKSNLAWDNNTILWIPMSEIFWSRKKNARIQDTKSHGQVGT